VSSLYFIHAVLVINDEPLFLIASAELLFSLGLAVCTAVFVRKRRELDAESGPNISSEP
jgi:uncharacterized membrane protein